MQLVMYTRKQYSGRSGAVVYLYSALDSQPK
jgi:hypothetical protein